MAGRLVGLWLLLGGTQVHGVVFLWGLLLPGVPSKETPVSFCEEEKPGCQSTIELLVNRLDSVESALPYKYDAFDFCQDETEKRQSENLGQILLGDRITSSPYKFIFKRNEVCQMACMKSYDPEKLEDKAKLDFLKKGMMLKYQHHWIVDNMPVTWCYDVEGGQKYCNPGFPVGCFIASDGFCTGACVINADFNKNSTFYPFNHVDITITYHSGKDENWPGARLVSVRLEPKSFKHTDANRLDCSSPPMEIPAEFSSKVDLIYTYSVEFEENNDIKWTSRWDYILESTPHNNVLWFSLVSSLAIVVFLSGMMAMILRWLRKDIDRYNQTDSSEDAQKKHGWMLVHGDVFRPPKMGMLLSVFLGQGTQIFITMLITLFFACLGVLSPANRGACMTCVVVLWVLLGVPAGYVSARMYKTFGGEKWKTNVLFTAVLCPGIIFAHVLIMNFIYWVNGSSATIPSDTLATILAMWFGIAVPLTFLGSYFGFKKPIEHPLPTNQIPRPIPEKSFFKRPLLGIALGGILPFGCIFIQLFFILNSIWTHQLYNMFGFLFLSFIIFLITCSEVTILLCYFHLCAEDYHWWWRSFLTSSFTAVYLFIFAVYYFFSKLQITGNASTILYFGYTMIMVLIFFLFAGNIGFCACFWFVHKFYSVTKPDSTPLYLPHVSDPVLTHPQQAKDINTADVSMSNQTLEVWVEPRGNPEKNEVA